MRISKINNVSQQFLSYYTILFIFRTSPHIYKPSIMHTLYIKALLCKLVIVDKIIEIYSYRYTTGIENCLQFHSQQCQLFCYFFFQRRNITVILLDHTIDFIKIQFFLFFKGVHVTRDIQVIVVLLDFF